ncbi:kinase-like domain-containing protein [Chytriomyces sp. MP71]|nr:kinase-like domain-containing protein [Chytriomyces sp. MP71]
MEDWKQVGNDTRVSSLWDGYGSIVRRQLKHAKTGEVASVVVKTVAPPPSKAASASESFRRKMISYEVERHFYSLHHSVTGGPRIARPWDYGKDFVILEDLAVEFPEPLPGAVSLLEAKAAMKWLAQFHGSYWGLSGRENPVRSMDPARDCENGVWDQGSYWYLATRGSEFAQLDAEWKELGRRVDEALAAIPNHLKTLVHGDAKTENIFLNRGVLDEDGLPVCAFYDFQYVGWGSGMKDIVYFIMTSLEELDEGIEAELLDWYFDCLQAMLQTRKDELLIGNDRELFSRNVMMEHYELCCIDWLRFLKGWGLWGAVPFLETHVAKIRTRRGW